MDSFMTEPLNFEWCQTHHSVFALADFIDLKRCYTYLALLLDQGTDDTMLMGLQKEQHFLSYRAYTLILYL